jgi:GNAT superfamily N-acetyltransferase
MSMTTRLGNAGDFQAIVPMLRQYRLWQEQLDATLYALHPDAESRFRRWVAHMAQDPRSTLVVAEEQDRLIGFVLATIERDLPIYLYEEFAIVREWWVEPDFRRRGVGKALIEHAAADLAGAGVQHLRVRTSAPDADARMVLQRCGFRPGTSEMVKELRISRTTPRR